MEKSFGTQFPRGFWCSVHVQMPGEVAGPGSNVHAAVKRAAQTLCEPDGNAPDFFEILVTKCDADTCLAPNYLEQVEWTYRQQLDGRRLLYHGLTSHSQNVCESNFVVQSEHYMTSHLEEIFSGDRFLGDFKPTYSHMSMTLGFCAEQGYWAPPDEISEDYVQSYKTIYIAGETGVKSVWCVNSLGLALSICDRYQQARRHMWGITMSCWSFAMLFESQIELFSHIAFIRQVCKQLLPNVTSFALVFITLSPQIVDLFKDLSEDTQKVICVLIAARYGYVVVVASVCELLMWTVIFHGRDDLTRPSILREILLVLTYPVLKPIIALFFAVGATWHNVIFAFRSHSFHFERTPKIRALSWNPSCGLEDFAQSHETVPLASTLSEGA